MEAARPEPVDPAHDKLVFLHADGKPWGYSTGLTKTDRLSWQFGSLLRKLGIKHGKGHQLGLNFYTLRHTFRTIADEAGDQHAVKKVMGHKIPGMDGVYVQKIVDRRIEKVSLYVRETIFGS